MNHFYTYFNIYFNEDIYGADFLQKALGRSFGITMNILFERRDLTCSIKELIERLQITLVANKINIEPILLVSANLPLIQKLIIKYGIESVNLSRNSQVTWDYILSNPYEEWNYETLCINPNITLDIVESNPDKKWAYHLLLINRSTRVGDLNKICQKVCMTKQNIRYWNPNLTWRDLYGNDVGILYELSRNTLERWNYASKIQHIFRRWIGCIRIKVLTDTLCRKDILNNILPFELCGIISSYSIL
jgi:hypothetical protein